MQHFILKWASRGSMQKATSDLLLQALQKAGADALSRDPSGAWLAAAEQVFMAAGYKTHATARDLLTWKKGHLPGYADIQEDLTRVVGASMNDALIDFDRGNGLFVDTFNPKALAGSMARLLIEAMKTDPNSARYHKIAAAWGYEKPFRHGGLLIQTYTTRWPATPKGRGFGSPLSTCTLFPNVVGRENGAIIIDGASFKLSAPMEPHYWVHEVKAKGPIRLTGISSWETQIKGTGHTSSQYDLERDLGDKLREGLPYAQRQCDMRMKGLGFSLR